MTRLYILVEGQTEEVFVKELLTPHYARIGLFITPIIVETSRGYKGGIVSYGKVKPQILRLCKQDSQATVTTLFDLYALPDSFPLKNSADYALLRTGHQKATFLELALTQDIEHFNFIANIMVHEFEALLFTQPEKFSDWVDNVDIVDKLVKIAQAYDTPEDINDSPHTAPSKRILKHMRDYQKTFHGPLIASDIGLDALRRTCPHFHGWVSPARTTCDLIAFKKGFY
jgi:hypothetical protein